MYAIWNYVITYAYYCYHKNVLHSSKLEIRTAVMELNTLQSTVPIDTK